MTASPDRRTGEVRLSVSVGPCGPRTHLLDMAPRDAEGIFPEQVAPDEESVPSDVVRVWAGRDGASQVADNGQTRSDRRSLMP